jgi:predicted nucleic acid-binding protein
MKFLLDTNTCIIYLRGKNLYLNKRVNDLQLEDWEIE